MHVFYAPMNAGGVQQVGVTSIILVTGGELDMVCCFCADVPDLVENFDEAAK